MDHLFYYLLYKNYTEKEAENIITCIDAGFKLSKKVLKDIKEYNKLWNEAYPNTLFNGVEIW